MHVHMRHPHAVWCQSSNRSVLLEQCVRAVWRQDDPSQRLNLVITRVAASGLFMLRKRRASSNAMSASMPSPEITIRVSHSHAIYASAIRI